MKKKLQRNSYGIHPRTIPVIEVTWLDHWGSDHWRKYDPDEDGKLLVCHSIGYLIDETKDTYVLAQTYAQDNSHPWAGMHVVAKDLVIKKKILSTKGQEIL